MPLPSLSALRAFEAAARLKSFKLAADELSVTPTAISHRIRVLEESLQRPLFIRKVRAVELTPQAEELHLAVRSGFDAINRAVERFRKPQRACVTVSTTPAFASKWLVPRIAQFQALHPDIDLHLQATNDPVNLEAGSVDLAVRYGLGKYKGLEVSALLADEFVPVASPAMARGKRGKPELWPMIHFEWQREMPVDLTWKAWARAARLNSARLQAGIRFSEESHAIQAAVAGQGMALLSRVLVQQELDLGLLKQMPGPVLQAMSYSLVRSRQVAEREEVKRVSEWLLACARSVSSR
ncbi:LysR substrate-binding domain-containing protein [Diaphorobacter aerolatus]|uniref:LysR family transcriptional regulator n=1 Tax=Diaphorobacter aerolatus TaxID=1288495 RepID=A0A7H0GNG0_9BURK|nr:LysR substrate-binding domain-containing protein [Diaphorobacter aerolatus]QNP49826.1 LysR family transcriptional regulator [Diaphorobacter aerolatus]